MLRSRSHQFSSACVILLRDINHGHVSPCIHGVEAGIVEMFGFIQVAVDIMTRFSEER
jgi:hypothetical protein